jgi:PAS domain S-box-containing protein
LDKTDHSPSFATWSGALHPDDREPTLERISAAAADGSVWSGEFRATWPNGEIRMIRAMARVVCSDDGRPETMIGTNWDVTELRRLTENLRIAAEHDRQTALVLHEKNRLMAMAEEMAHVGHWRLDLATGESYCSEEILRAHGLPSTHRLDLKAALAAYHPDDRDAVAGIVERAVASGADYSYEARIIRSDGAIRHVLSRGQCERSQAGNVVAIFGVFQDITSLKDSERERLRLLERVTLAAKSGKIGIWERDLRTDELIWDATMFKLYGIPPQSTSPSAELWKTLVHPLDVERVTSAAKRYTGSEPLEIEYRIVWPTGEVRHVRSQGTILRDDTGDPVRIVGTFWDITEIRSLTEQLGREKDAAEAANIAKSDFLANMSHEIRTPMNGVIGLTSLLLDGEVTPEQRAQLTLLADSGRSLLAIINDILDLSKVEAGKMELESLVMSVGGLVDGALSIVRSEASAKGLALTATLATDIPTWVTGDPTRLRQILLNLLTNAIKFTDRGRVELSVRRIDRTSDLIKFEIADTGIGIAPDRQHLLFEKFSQADRTIARAYGGTGLGLALSRRLTEAMSGTMGFSSVPGSGSTFWFTARLPASDAPRATSATRTASAAPPLRILVVDDNATNLVVVKGMLSQDGHHVEVAHDGAEGLAAVQASRYDLVFMDMHMPVLDGLAATRRIRALALPMSRVPIIALSANVMSTEIERCKEAGMDDHVAKPIDRIRLQRIVADWSQSEWKARATGVAPQPPIFDLQPLIDALADDAASLESVLDDAIASMRVQVERIAHGIRDEDTASVIAAAHHLTGTFRELRALDLANLASQIEHTPAAEFWTSAVASLGELESMTAALTASIETSKRDFVLR